MDNVEANNAVAALPKMTDQQKQDIEKALSAVNQIAIEVIKLSKSPNMQALTQQALNDALTNSALKSSIADAIGVLKNLPTDFKNIDLVSGIELIEFEVSGVQAIIKALKS